MQIEDAALAVWFAAFVTIVTLCFIIIDGIGEILSIEEDKPIAEEVRP